jgi:hypothetical protein
MPARSSPNGTQAPRPESLVGRRLPVLPVANPLLHDTLALVDHGLAWACGLPRQGGPRLTRRLG